jgi:UPF0755 protein
MWHSGSKSEWKKNLRITLGVGLFLLISGLLTYSYFFGPVQKDAGMTEFTVDPDMTVASVAQKAVGEDLAQSSLVLQLVLIEKADGRLIRPGTYKLSGSMDTWTVAHILTQPPAIAFVTFPPSIRKEQMGVILANALGWSPAQKEEWNTVATNPDPDFIEGVYYPDTYWIPSDQTPTQIAARLRGRFTDVFQPYLKESQEKGIPWTDVLTLASIVDRESSKDDKALVAGILWNRLEIGMRLQADATLQYIRGTEGSWWPQPKSEDKYLESPFNTYQNTGLPPHPINNPTMASIEAVLNPDSTDCLFYLHDADHQIHCSITYAGQQDNVERYLR